MYLIEFSEANLNQIIRSALKDQYAAVALYSQSLFCRHAEIQSVCPLPAVLFLQQPAISVPAKTASGVCEMPPGTQTEISLTRSTPCRQRAAKTASEV